jgi:NCAIR mutase (PurE)-related protein
MFEDKEIIQLLRDVAAAKVTVSEAYNKLRRAPFEDLGYARVDLHRGIRQGMPEVIYGKGKTAAQIEGIVRSLADNDCRNVLITRLDQEKAAVLRAHSIELDYHADAAIGIAFPAPIRKTGNVLVASAGTSDQHVAEEAALTAETTGSRVTRLYDVGVAGIHRLLAQIDLIMNARCIVAVAGMEGALPSVIGGLADCPVIAVPTSVGYGASFGGVAALLGMLNSCAAGVSVVNIDNGFGAGYLASKINLMDGVHQTGERPEHSERPECLNGLDEREDPDGRQSRE